MWWGWVLFIVCAVLALGCFVDTAINWAKGKTGPFGPKPEDWWGCGLFTITLLAVMFWLGKTLFE